MKPFRAYMAEVMAREARAYFVKLLELEPHRAKAAKLAGMNRTHFFRWLDRVRLSGEYRHRCNQRWKRYTGRITSH